LFDTASTESDIRQGFDGLRCFFLMIAPGSEFLCGETSR
jgi:hypothetical protein